MANNSISAVIITFNEEDNIGRCLDSLAGVADEIIVIDSFSTDKTRQICEARNTTVISHQFEGHIEQKNFAAQQATFDYVLSLDADEALSEELKKSLLKEKPNLDADGYEISRITSYCGKWIKHCGWYPDRKIRLWNRKKGEWGGVNPHDKVIMANGSSVKRLKGDILHYSFPTIQSHIATISSFSEIASLEAIKMNKKVNVFYHLILNPTFTFVNKYIFKLGFLDGYYGFVISVLSAFANFVKYSKIRELNKKKFD